MNQGERATPRRFRRARIDTTLCKLLLMIGLGGLACVPLTARAGNLSGCPSSFEVPASGSATLNTFNCSDTYGSLNGLGTDYPAFTPDSSPPQGPDEINTTNGTAVNVDDDDQYLEYTNNGDGSTTDSYTWVDANDINHTETISILNISTSTLPNATVGTAYNQTISGAGGTTSGYDFTSTTLPAGLSLSSSGVLSGTPTASGSYSFTVTLSDGVVSVSRTYSSFTVANASISIAPSSLPNGTVGAVYSQTLSASGGTSPYAFTITAGALPAGLSMSSSGVISGTPTAGGTFNLTVRATDADSNTATKTYSGWTIAAPIVTVSPSTLSSGTQGSAYSQAITANGGIAPYTFVITSGSLPSGLTLSSNGTLSGTPTSYGTFTFTVTAMDSSTGSGPYTGSTTYNLSVSASPPSIVTNTVPNGTVGVSYSTTIVAGGGSPPYTYSLFSGSLPQGLSLSSSGLLSGTPTAAGAYTFTVKVTDSVNSTATKTYTNVTIGAPTITVSPATVPAATQNSNYSQTISASGGIAPYTYAVSSGSLPPGMTLNAASGVLSGTPTTYGNFSFTVTATDSSGGTGPYTGSTTYSLQVNASAPVISPTSLPNGTVGVSYSQTISASNGNAPYTFSLFSGSLPPGLSLTSSGALSGTPTAGGSYSFAVKVTDSASNVATQSYAGVVVSAPTLSLSPTTPGAATVGASYSQSFSASGGTAPYTYAESGSLPVGVSWNASTATLSGTPTQGGSFPITIQVTDSSGGSGPYTHAFSETLQVNAASLSITPAGNTTFTATYGAAYSQSFTGSGGTSPYSFSVSSGSLPAGVNLSGGGTLSGTPTQTGHFSFTVTMTDSSTGTGAPYSTSASYSLTVSAGTIAITPSTLPNGTVAASYSAQLSASGGIGPYTYSITAGSLPAGLTLSSSGALSGTPTAAGSFNVTVTATDANSVTGSQAYTFSIAAPTLSLSPTSLTLPEATAESTYTQSFTTSGGTAPYQYTVASGALPPGLSLSSSGALTGTPTAAGSYTFTVKSTDSSTGSGAPFSITRSYSLTVQAPTLSISPTTLTNPQQAVAYSQQLSTSGGDGSYTYSISAGALPAGLSLSTAGLLSGTSTVNGPFSFTVSVKDGDNFTAAQSYSVTVSAPSVPTVAAKSVSTPYNTTATINLSGSVSGLDITAINIATQPAHGTISVSGETVAYTPSSTFYGGTDSFTYTATNPGGTSAPATVTVTIAAPATPTVAAKSVSTPYGTATSIDLSGSISGVDVTAVTVATAPTHGTASVSGKTITYTPSSTFYGGTDSFTYTATNPGGTSSPATVTIAVTPLNVPTAAALSVDTTTGTPVTIQATTNAGGPQPFTGVSVAGAPAHGSASVSGEQIVYTPSTGFVGTDSFTYEISNHFGSSAPATITVTVTKAGSSSGQSMTVTTTPNTPVNVNLGEIVAGDYASSAVLGLSPGMAGSTSISQPTSLTFTPSGGYLGLAQITVVLTTASGQTATVHVLVLVSSQPDPSKNRDAVALIDAQATTAQQFALSQIDNIQQRLDSLHDGATPLFSDELALSLDGKSLGSAGSNAQAGTDPNGGSNVQRPGIGAAGDFDSAGTPQAGQQAGNSAAGRDSKTSGKPSPTGLGLWIDGQADFGSFDSYRQAAGFSSDNIAVNAGADQRIGEDVLVGLSLGYNHNNSNIGQDGTRSVAQGYSAALYGSFQPTSKIYIDGLLGGGGLSFDNRRFDPDSGSYLSGTRSGSMWFASITGGYEYRSNGFVLSPYGQLKWSYADLNAYEENGVVTAALAYGDQAVRNTTAVLGIRGSSTVKLDEGVLLPHVRLEVGYNFQGMGNTSLSYAYIPTAGTWNISNSPYALSGTSVQLGFGVDLQLPRELILTTDYGYMLQQGFHDQMIRFGLSKQF
jgi:large repetitive protein